MTKLNAKFKNDSLNDDLCFFGFLENIIFIHKLVFFCSLPVNKF